MTKILAAIPAFNEEVAIGSIVLRCHLYVDEVLVIDDGSGDRTSGVAKLAHAVVRRHETNAGKGVAIQTALDYARANGFDAMVLLDGDGQHDPEDIPSLLRPVLADEADIVVGVRERLTSAVPLYRRAGQKVLDFLTAWGAMDRMTDSQSGFRALSRPAIELLVLEEPDFSVESEMIIEAKDKNLRTAEVPIRVRYDVEGSTKGPFTHGFGIIDRLLRIIAVRHPLLFFGVPGLVLFVIGIGWGIALMTVYNETRLFAIGWALLTIICLVLGAIAGFVGVILNVMPRAVIRSLEGRSRIGRGRREN